MKIIIPMSGLGSRFQNAGYALPKPLITVLGKPIIEHVISMFPGDHSFIFICNRGHLETTNMREVLQKIKPESIIISLDTHLHGPVYATMHAFDHIDDDEEVLISYCDYYMEWDFEHFQKIIAQNDFDGAVPGYTGFHPHLLHKNLYAGMLVNGDNVLEAIQEKHSFTENPMESFHSPGTYYFKRGSDLKKYTKELLESDLRINGEAYTSMLYYFYLRDNKKIYVPTVKRFIQLGTPEDLEEFESWYRHLLQGRDISPLPSSVPALREIKIPYNEESPEYLWCRGYWESFFAKLRIA